MNTIKHSFFCQSIDAGYLSPEESNHAVRVLRLKMGDKITLVDGKGRLAEAEIQDADKRKTRFRIVSEIQKEASSRYLHIAIAPTKNMDRFLFFIEKAIEIGVEEITPVRTSNSERKVLNSDKVQKNAISALKQSGNLFFPKINELTDLQLFLNRGFEQQQLFIAHCESDSDKIELKNEIGTKKNIVILVGPEGDFTPEEISFAKEKNFTPVSLGESRLRTETAGIVACHTVNIIS